MYFLVPPEYVREIVAEMAQRDDVFSIEAVRPLPSHGFIEDGDYISEDEPEDFDDDEVDGED